jgi:2-oxoisovalerate dehydrogenase E1 component
MGLAGGYSDGRDIGAVFNYPNPGGAHALPMSGGVGAQFTPAVGWAQAIQYKRDVLAEGPDDAIALVLGGDASCATGGFWSALTIATTQSLPLLIYIEDNGYGISVPSEYQTPGKDIAANLASFRGLTIFNGDGTEPEQAAQMIRDAVAHVRDQRTPALLRLTVPRLEGHSAQDTQGYKSEDEIAEEWTRDPLPKLRAHCAALQIDDEDWERLASEVAGEVGAARAEAESRGVSDPDRVTDQMFFEGDMQQVGGEVSSM